MKKMGAKAEIHRNITKKTKNGKPDSRDRSMAINLPSAAEIVGDGNAVVGKTRTEKVALPFSKASVSCSCHVLLTCDQNDQTVFKTYKLCSAIIKNLLEEDREEMTEFLNAMDETLED